MNKTALKIWLLLTITLGLYLSVNLVDIVEVSADDDDDYAAFTIVRPENITYSRTNVELQVSRKGFYANWWYSLDEGEWEYLSEGKTTLKDLSEGAHSLVIRAWDRKNGYIYSGVVFSVDTTPPEIAINSPQEKTYSTSEIDLDFTVSETVNWIAYSLDSKENVPITESTILSGLSDGEHRLKIYVEDTAGNTGASDTVTFKVDTTPPKITITSPERTTYTTTNVFLDFTINEKASWIGYSLDGEENVTITGKPILYDLSEGSHSIIVFANDTAGNTGASSTIQFTISITPADITPPIVVITSPESTTFSVSTVVLDFAVNEEVTWIGYSLDGHDNVTITGDTVLSGLSEGSHIIVVFANDNAGNTGTSDVVQFVVSTFPVDITPPTISINSPKNTTYEVSEVPLDFSVNEDTSWIGFSLDGQNNITVSEDIILSGLAEGSHSMVVFANDTIGNTGASEIVQFVVSITSEDTTLPTVIVNSPENTTYNTNEISLTFTVNEEPTQKFYSLDGKANITVVDSTVLSDLSAGEHTLIIYAQDSTGNIGVSQQVTFTITKSNADRQLWIVGVIGMVAFTGFMFSTYIAYDLIKSHRK